MGWGSIKCKFTISGFDEDIVEYPGDGKLIGRMIERRVYLNIWLLSYSNLE